MGKKKLSQAEFCERINKTHKHPYKVLEDYRTIDTPLRNFDLKRIEIILDTVFNDYLHSSNTCNKCIMESTSQTIGGGNIDISKYIVNFWDKI